MFRSRTSSVILAGAVIGLTGCGTQVPQVGEVWEDVSITSDMEFSIKLNIFCETIEAIRYANKNVTLENGNLALPNSFGVQMQIGLTVDETGALNPGVTYTDPLKNAIVNGATAAQSFSLAAGGTLSSQATRTDTTYSYYNIGRITAPGANVAICSDKWVGPIRKRIGPFYKSDLGIEDYLMQVLPGMDVFPSSVPAKGGAGKSAKLDVFSYEIKFVVVSNGNLTPSWKLVNISANSGNLPLLNLGRTRTHDLILTFGPGLDKPTDFALQTHFTTQIVESNRRQRQGGM
ncbi:MAG: hypothetical protein JWP25_6072 [Bradyrhizobium sp.]|nr:hypothetical protein [Bradyrhizobium sp.]